MFQRCTPVFKVKMICLFNLIYFEVKVSKISTTFGARKLFSKKISKREAIDFQCIPLALCVHFTTNYSNLRHKSTIMPKIQHYYII